MPILHEIACHDKEFNIFLFNMFIKPRPAMMYSFMYVYITKGSLAQQ